MVCIRCGRQRTTNKAREFHRFKGFCRSCSALRAEDAAKVAHLARYESRHGRPSATVLGGKSGQKMLSPLHVVVCPKTGVHTSLSRRKNGVCRCAACGTSDVERKRIAASGEIRLDAIACKYCARQIEVIRGAGTKGNFQHVCKTCTDERKRENKARREGMRRGTALSGYVGRISVFKRDGWRCQSCGCDTPRALMGTLNDNAPELDHIVPLSAGGPHTQGNTQCLCRVCNILKGAMPMRDFTEWNLGRPPGCGERLAVFF